MKPRVIRWLISYLKGIGRLEGYADTQQTGLRFVVYGDNGRTRIMRPGTAKAFAEHLEAKQWGLI